MSNKLLKRIQIAGTVKVPRGHHPRRHWERVWGMGTARTNEILRKAVEGGIMGMEMHRIYRPGSGCHPTPHYFEK